MAGGVGSRFWPESTEERPKQFLDLTGSGKALLRQTFERLVPLIPPERILVITNARYRPLTEALLPELPPGNILAEPAGRNTAPAVLYAAEVIRARDPEAVFAVLPADHYIGDEEAFRRALAGALEYARSRSELLTMGIRPDAPHTGYGYIAYDPADNSPFKKVLRFVEKPSLEKARAYLDAGNYLWNAGIFVWSVPAVREAFRRHLPRMFEAMQQVPWSSPDRDKVLERVFPALENISVDYGIMEKADNVRVLPVDFDWNDLGSWDAIHRQLARSSDENVTLEGELWAENARGNLVKAPGKKVVIDGLEDYIVVDRGDVLMIIPRAKAQEVKKWRERVEKSRGGD
ncbi:MAG: mannose-1-phosphate guanylyltransferase [Chlorobi bacterium]|nr:mannose-1-phosphate guanylyltransferase [Chlorobiota bacterium]